MIPKFNTNNFSQLVKLRDNKEPITILLGNEPVLYIADGLIKNVNGNTTRALHSVLFTNVNMTMSSKAGIQQAPAGLVNTDEKENQLAIELARYFAELDQNSLNDVNTQNLVISYNAKLNFREYNFYLTHTDVMLSPILYQWLEARFKEDQLGKIPYDTINSQLSHLLQSTDKKLLIRTLLMLVSLGFINPHFNVQKATQVIKPKSSSQQPQQSTTSANSNNSNDAIRDKLLIVAGMANNFAEGIYDMIIRCGGEKYNINLSQEDSIADVILKSILSSPEPASIQPGAKSEMDDTTAMGKKLKLFKQIKTLPLELFEQRFDGENYFYRFSLKDPNYLAKLPLYRNAGMELLEITLLSLLKIKNFSSGEISLKISNFTLSEIRRSIFALIILGLITTTKEKNTPDVEVTIPQQSAPPAAATGLVTNKSLLQKLMDRIKVI